MGLTTIPFDAAPYLADTEAQAELLNDALQSGDASYIGEALAVIARARGLSGDGTGDVSGPRADAAGSELPLARLLEVARDLGVRLKIQTIAAE